MEVQEIASRIKEMKTVCLSGTPAMMRSRTDFIDMLTGFGISASISISKRTGVLIVCEQPNERKLRQAEIVGVPILNESQWFELIPELEAQGMWTGKTVCADENGIYRVAVDGDG